MQPSIGSLRRPARTDIVMDHLNDTISLVMEQKKQLRELFSAPIDLPALVRRLEKPKGPVDVVIDTDAYNEIDDQYAISYLVKKSDKLKLQALYAAPFFNDKSTGPEDGMEKSYQEILKLLKLMGRSDLSEKEYRGSVRYLPSETEPVQSDAAKDLAERAMGYTPEKPLYVVAIGAITNVASALLLNALKAVGGIGDQFELISAQVLEPVCRLKTQYLGHKNPRLHTDEVLMALTISALTNPLAELAQQQLPKLRGCDAHFTVILSEVDENLLRRLGINVSCEARYETKKLYHK